MASLITHSSSQNGKDKFILLFSNPNNTEDRYNMTIKASLDDGMTWPENFIILLMKKRVGDIIV
jgi:sialidase-1